MHVNYKAAQLISIVGISKECLESNIEITYNNDIPNKEDEAITNSILRKKMLTLLPGLFKDENEIREQPVGTSTGIFILYILQYTLPYLQLYFQ